MTQLKLSSPPFRVPGRVPGVLRNGTADLSFSGCTPSLPETVFPALTSLLEGEGPTFLFFCLSLFIPPQSLMTLSECPQVWPVHFLSSDSQAKGHQLLLSLYQKPNPVHFPPPPPSLPPVSGVIRGSCLNWEKGPHPAFTLPVGLGGGGWGGGGLAGWTPESWAAGRVLGSPPSASPLLS